MAFSTAAQLKDLWKHFGAVEAVRGVSLRVPAGCIYGLLGPGGMGKTTLNQPSGARSGLSQLSGIRRLARTRMLCSMVEASGASPAQRRYSLKASMALRYSRVWW